jgi:hypothetical protein
MKVVFWMMWMVLILTSGCASIYGKKKAVILQDPATMDFVECKVNDEWATAASFAKNDECVEEYKKRGFIVWGER